MLKDMLNDLNEYYSKEYEMAAIWLEKPLKTATERTVRIAEGHLVAVEDGKLVDCTGMPTHKVIGCMGTINSSSLSFVLTDLETNQPITIKIQ